MIDFAAGSWYTQGVGGRGLAFFLLEGVSGKNNFLHIRKNCAETKYRIAETAPRLTAVSAETELVYNGAFMYLH